MIANATVVATNQETGATAQAATTGTGNYTIPQLPAGQYDISVQLTGFKRFVQKGIAVQAAQTARIDIAMQIGETADTVTVTADAPLRFTTTTARPGDLTNNCPSDGLSESMNASRSG